MKSFCNSDHDNRGGNSYTTVNIARKYKVVLNILQIQSTELLSGLCYLVLHEEGFFIFFFHMKY